jgi:predicted outer membrane repeat protein
VASDVTPNRALRRAAARRGRKLAALGSGAVLVSGAAGMALTLSASPAGAAATFTVDDSGDSGPVAGDCTDITVGNCSLRDAIAAANFDPVEDTINFAPTVTGTITLTSDLTKITEAVDIQGPGASVLTIDGQDDYQVFLFDNIDSGTPSISGLTITNGYSNGRTSDDSGGAIGLYESDTNFTFSNLVISSSAAYNDGAGLNCGPGDASVMVINTTFDHNDAGQSGTQGGGGGLYFDCDGDLTVTNSTFTGNTSYDSGGALYFGGAALLVSGSTFTGNTSYHDHAGGIWLNGDEATITHTTLNTNHADGGGGGIYEDDGTLHVSDSRVSGNTSDAWGGGLYLTGDDVLIERTTIAGNESENSGGGLEVFSVGDVTVLDSTISGNISGNSAGGFYLSSSSTLLTIANSTIAGNTADVNGGGIAVANGDLSLLQTTVSGNTATTGLGDGLYFQGYQEPPPLRAGAHADQQAKLQADFAEKVARGEADPADAPVTAQATAQEAGTAILTGTIVSGNIGADDINSDGDAPVAITANSSLLGGLSGITLSGAGNLTGVNNPGLSPLANNGGPTQTMALTATSPALDAGPTTVPTFPGNTTDQRGTGFPRVVNGRVDIGAFERQLEALFTG